MPDHTDPEWLREAYQDMTQAEMAEAAGVGVSTISRHMRKHEIDTSRSIPEEWLREDLLQAAKELGQVPSYKEYSEIGEYGSITVTNTLGNGSWNRALKSVGLKPTDFRNIPVDNLSKDLIRVSEELGRTPGKREYDELGKYGMSTIMRMVGDGSWNDALRHVNLEPNLLRNIDKEDIREDLLSVAEDLGRVPGLEEYDELGTYGYETVSHRLSGGSWIKALRSVDLWPIEYDGVAMRSSYEPTVAQRLDELGISWEYEPEQLQTDAGGYTPDFVLDDGTIVEVKGMPRLMGKAPKLEELMADRRVIVVGTEWWRDRLPCDDFVLYDDVGSFEP